MIYKRKQPVGFHNVEGKLDCFYFIFYSSIPFLGFKTMLLTQLLSLFLLARLSLASPTRDTSTPLPPSQDPWYSAPNGFESASPGSILRIRSAPGNATTVFSNSSAVYNILYRTTNAHYQPFWAVTTLLVPKQTKGTALLSYQIPYNTADVDGSPSYSLYAPVNPALGNIVNVDIQTALGMGWYVNVPDHEGPLASFLEGVQEGHAVLDSVRAALQTDCGLAKDARYAMWGYSGGSIASEWAAELQVQYAPEMKFAGAALGGLVSNLTAAFPVITGGWSAGLIPEGLLGITSQYPAAYDYLVSQLKTNGPYNKTTFLSAKDMTIAEAFVFFANQSAFDYFKTGADVLNAPVMQNVINQQGYMGFHGTPEMPLFIYKAIHDELTPIASTDDLVDRYCGVGVNIVYERNKIGGHLAEETNGDKRALEWLTQVLGGSYKHTGCTIKNVAINITNSPL